MQKYFFEVRNFVESQYPSFRGNISGANYPPPLFAQYFAQFTSFIWIVGIALLLAGSQIFSALGIPEPEFYHWANNNKVAVFVGLFILNNIGNSMITTGAFEVYLNDELIYSRLQSGGRMPNGEDIINALAARSYFVDAK